MILTGKKVLITGGTGSLGTATLMLSEKENFNTDFIIFSRDETKQSLMRQKFPQHTYILGDVAKRYDVERVVRGIKPDIILHYAAYKQIPSAQNNVWATIETNVVGSQNIVDAALTYGVEKVVASSTDKACNPQNAYGSSKHIMECLFQNANRWNSTTFHLSRYGNVICSNQSVIPMFIKQKEAGGPLTVTRREMTRFWIDLKEAVNLILLSLEQESGVIVVPKASAMSMGDLVDYIIGEDKIEIKDLNIRPGEKLHECMVSPAESLYTQQDDNFFYIYSPTTEVINEVPFSYCSNDPKYWLTYQQLEEKIAVSKELGS